MTTEIPQEMLIALLYNPKINALKIFCIDSETAYKRLLHFMIKLDWNMVGYL